MVLDDCRLFIGRFFLLLICKILLRTLIITILETLTYISTHVYILYIRLKILLIRSKSVIVADNFLPLPLQHAYYIEKASVAPQKAKASLSIAVMLSVAETWSSLVGKSPMGLRSSCSLSVEQCFSDVRPGSHVQTHRAYAETSFDRRTTDASIYSMYIYIQQYLS